VAQEAGTRCAARSAAGLAAVHELRAGRAAEAAAAAAARHAAEYRDLLDEKLGRLHVQVTLAHEPDEARSRRSSAELTRITGRTVIPHISVDPALLGGIVVRYGDHVMDGSLRRRLLSLRTGCVEARCRRAADGAARGAPGS
jgi:hypothetical protein